MFMLGNPSDRGWFCVVQDRTTAQASMPWEGSRATLRCIQATCSPTGFSVGGGGSWATRLPERLLRAAARMAPAVAAE